MRPPRLPWTVIIGVLLIGALLGLAWFALKVRQVATRHAALPVYGQIAAFTLTNQSGGAVTLADLRGRVWVADMIFTRCPGPCLKMTRQMKQLQDAIPDRSATRLVTLTTDPDFDTPPVLARYADRFQADTNRWLFLTGPRQAIVDLAVGSLKLTSVEKKPEERESPADLFVHSTIFVVVDKQGRLRGIYETAGEDTDWDREKRALVAAIRQLERER